MGFLHLITLPIGNVDDITFRAKKILERETFFLAEDTRVFRSFLKTLGIDAGGKKIISFHDYSSEAKIKRLLEELEKGNDLFLATDAGSPVISDPAYPLIREVLNKGHDLKTCPGTSSVIAALELSGLPTTPFFFYGFLPRNEGKIKNILESFKNNSGTYVFFESPARILKTLKCVSDRLPECDVVVARELTKKYESIYRFKGSEFGQISQTIVTKGEFVVLVHVSRNTQGPSIDSAKLGKMVMEYLEKSGNKKMLAKIFAEILNKNPKEIFKLI